jgi:hypothetical protein
MDATMSNMINGGGDTKGGTQTQHDATQGGTRYAPISINEAALFEDGQPQVTKGASRRWRICAFVRHGWMLDKIQFVVPNKGVSHFERRSQLLPQAQAFGRSSICERPE